MQVSMRPSRLIAAGLGTGFAPEAPGTAGSLLGLVIGTALLQHGLTPLALGTLAATLLGLWAIQDCTRLPIWRPGGDPFDPGWIVIDEIAGQMLAMLALPRATLPGVTVAFALFRLFDIRKPGPIGWLDRQGGAAAIMGDDVLAGIFAALVLLGVRAAWPELFS